MQLDRLRLFVTVAQSGSLTQAARALRMQQPTLSRHIAELERETGTPLFERRARGVALTPAGARLRAATEPLFEQLELAAAQALDSDHAARGDVAFGVSEVLAATIFPRVQRHIVDTHPDLIPYAVVAPSDVLIDRVRAGTLHFALLTHAKKSPGLTMQELAQLQHRLVVAKRQRKNRSVLARFIGSREVEDPGNRHFPTLDRLRRTVPRAHLAASSNSLSAHLALVKAGFGVAILPECLIVDELRKKTLVALYPHERPRYPVWCVSATQRVWTTAARRYVEVWQSVLALSANGRKDETRR